ncbi:MAG: 1-deoxy-D-xylulose-5-phosphate reductoisomerase [Candidatus Omnitrophota bacterium]
MKRIVIFGSTGSIGCNTLSVVRRFPEEFRVVGFSAHQQVGLLKKQVAEFEPEVVVLTDKNPGGFGRTKVLSGPDGLKKLAFWPRSDLVVMAIPGSGSLMPASWALEAGRNLALASKEALVMAGELLIARAKKAGVRIIPLDSEHNAIFQILSAYPGRPVKKVFLTASGGPFLNQKKKKVSIKEALEHPVWKMGRKVTIDSATMVNKALEIIEAHHLFGLPPEKIGVLIHPEVLVHGLVEFEDGFITANLSVPDMKMPIAAGLFWPEDPPDTPVARAISLSDLSRLTFRAPSPRQFPALGLAYDVLKKGGSYPAAFSVANEEAVNAFLTGKIGFEAILSLVRTVVKEHRPIFRPDMSDILAVAEDTRTITRSLIKEYFRKVSPQ